jgi:hypothetical protein
MQSIAPQLTSDTTANNDEAHQTIVVKIEWPTEPLRVQMVQPPRPPATMSYRFDQMGTGHILWSSTGNWGTAGDQWTPEDWELAPRRFVDHWNPEFRPNPYKGEVETDR